MFGDPLSVPTVGGGVGSLPGKSEVSVGRLWTVTAFSVVAQVGLAIYASVFPSPAPNRRAQAFLLDFSPPWRASGAHER